MLQPGHAAAQFQHRQLAGEVAPSIGEGVLQAVAHARLRREMNDEAERPARPRQRRQRFGVGGVEAREAEIARIGQTVEPRALQADVVIVVQCIDAHDAVAARRQRPRDMKADEPRGAGDENAHARSPKRRIWRSEAIRRAAKPAVASAAAAAPSSTPAI